MHRASGSRGGAVIAAAAGALVVAGAVFAGLLRPVVLNGGN